MYEPVCQAKIPIEGCISCCLGSNFNGYLVMFPIITQFGRCCLLVTQHARCCVVSIPLHTILPREFRPQTSDAHDVVVSGSMNVRQLFSFHPFICDEVVYNLMICLMKC